MSDQLTIYTDGGCHGNPGPGAWAALLSWRGHEKMISGFDPETTNNRMELMAAVGALQSLKRHPMTITLWTDSRYLQDGITKWVDGWRKNGWKTANKQPVKNKDLWELLVDLVDQHNIQFEWVKGHSGHPENERVDGEVQRVIQAHAS